MQLARRFGTMLSFVSEEPRGAAARIYIWRAHLESSSALWGMAGSASADLSVVRQTWRALWLLSQRGRCWMYGTAVRIECSRSFERRIGAR